MKEVPIWEKSNLTLEEAAAYSGVGINKLRSLSDHERCQFVLFSKPQDPCGSSADPGERRQILR